jgi:hypothetical protein
MYPAHKYYVFFNGLPLRLKSVDDIMIIILLSDCEYSNECSNSIKGKEFYDELSSLWLL